jgi:heat shock protein HslJ
MIGFGCRKANEKDADLVKVKWELSYIQDTKTNEIKNFPEDATKKISIDFTDSLNILSFSGICNGGTGTYSYSSDKGEIKFANIGTTLIGCKYSEWEGYTIQNLYEAFRFEINGRNLGIYSNGKYNLHFTQK